MNATDPLDETCRLFEKHWGTDKCFRIEDVIRRVSEQRKPIYLKALLQVEIRLRAGDDRIGLRKELHDRFQHFSDIVEFALQEVADTVDRQTPTVDLNGSTADTTDEQPLECSRKIGRFLVQREIGQGAMGVVFHAVDPQLKREVAIKVPKGKYRSTEKARRRFLNEARSAAGLNHPGICPVYDLGIVDDVPYICMAYLDGVALADHVKRVEVTEIRAAKLILRIAEALNAAHRQGVIHRDLKPANVMVMDGAQPVILDFGLARLLGEESPGMNSSTGGIVGTPAYMSPEQITCGPKAAAVGPTTDIYSLGVMLFELLTGRRPYTGTMADIIGQIATKEPPRPSEINRKVNVRLERICQKMMARVPSDRHASMAEVTVDLQAYVDKFDGSPNVSSQPATSGKTTAAEQEISRLLAVGQFAKAEKRLLKMVRDVEASTDDKCEHGNLQWAAHKIKELRASRDELRKSRSELCAAASDFLKDQDYEQAEQLLADYPEELRSKRMVTILQTCRDRLNAAETLKQQIRRLNAKHRYAETIPLVDRLLAQLPKDSYGRQVYHANRRRFKGPLATLLGAHTPAIMRGWSAEQQWTLLFCPILLLVLYSITQFYTHPSPATPTSVSESSSRSDVSKRAGLTSVAGEHSDDQQFAAEQSSTSGEVDPSDGSVRHSLLIPGTVLQGRYWQTKTLSWDINLLIGDSSAETVSALCLATTARDSDSSYVRLTDLGFEFEIRVLSDDTVEIVLSHLITNPFAVDAYADPNHGFLCQISEDSITGEAWDLKPVVADSRAVKPDWVISTVEASNGHKWLYRSAYTDIRPSLLRTAKDATSKQYRLGKAPFGDEHRLVQDQGTTWDRGHLHLWSEFQMPDMDTIQDLYLRTTHENNVAVWVNGLRLEPETGSAHKDSKASHYQLQRVSRDQHRIFQTGRNCMAVRVDGQLDKRVFDLGLRAVRKYPSIRFRG